MVWRYNTNQPFYGDIIWYYGIPYKTTLYQLYMGLSKKMESQIHGHPIVDHNFRPHSRKLGYPPFLDKAMWVKKWDSWNPMESVEGKVLVILSVLRKTAYLEYERMIKNEQWLPSARASTQRICEVLIALNRINLHQPFRLLEDGEHQLRGLAKQGLCGLQRQLLPTEALIGGRRSVRFGDIVMGWGMDLGNIWQFSWESWQPWYFRWVLGPPILRQSLFLAVDEGQLLMWGPQNPPKSSIAILDFCSWGILWV